MKSDLTDLFNPERMHEPFIAPSILAGDFGNLNRDIEMLNASASDWIHVDVMDGLFVPNISFGFPVIQAIRKVSTKPLDVHLMIQNPDLYLERMKDAGADRITVHYEACVHLNRTLDAIHKLGLKAGVALNPHSPVFLLQDILDYTDLVLLMSVNPGFGGQKFIGNTYSKIASLVELRSDKGASALIEIDGGVDLENAGLLIASGAEVLVAGSSVFASTNPSAMISSLKTASRKEELN